MEGPIHTWKDHNRNIVCPPAWTPIFLLWFFQVLIGPSRYWHESSIRDKLKHQQDRREYIERRADVVLWQRGTFLTKLPRRSHLIRVDSQSFDLSWRNPWHHQGHKPNVITGITIPTLLFDPAESLTIHDPRGFPHFYKEWSNTNLKRIRLQLL